MGCSFGSNAAADGPATRSTEEVLAIEGAIGAAGPGAQTDVALLGQQRQHLSPEVTGGPMVAVHDPRWRSPGTNRSGVQGVHLNPLGTSAPEPPGSRRAHPEHP